MVLHLQVNIGCPVDSPFILVDTIINPQTIESVSQYIQVCQKYCNCNISIADKQGVQSKYFVIIVN